MNEEHRDFMANAFQIIIDKGIETGQLDLDAYKELNSLPLQIFEDQEEAYKVLSVELERVKLSERLIKGAEMIEKESDPNVKRQYMAVYDQLLIKLESLRKPA